MAFLQQHRRRVEYLQVEHRGVGGEEERKLSFLQKSDSNQFVSCGLAEKSRNQFLAELKRENIICMKVKVEWIHPYCSICVVLGDLSSVLDEESVDLKVLYKQIYQIMKTSLYLQ